MKNIIVGFEIGTAGAKLIDTKQYDCILYKFGSVGSSEEFVPMVTLKGFDLIKQDELEEISELMNLLKFKVKKMGVNAELKLYTSSWKS